MTPSKPAPPLQGIKIVEFSSVVTAALAATLLSEQGADTIKIEPVQGGDTLRYLGSSLAGVSAAFANCNRGKRSLALDMKTTQGIEIARKLALQADILISNYRPGVLQRLGLGSAELRAQNPGLIYVAISGFGTEGPLAAAPAYDHVIQALSGITELQGSNGEVDFIKTFVCDEITAYTACQAATAALFARTRTGQGQHIDLSMLDCAVYFQWPAGMQDHTFLSDQVAIKPSLKTTYRAYTTSDGFIAMAPYTDQHWRQLLIGLGHAELADDPRYNSMAGRAQNIKQLLPLILTAFSQRTSAENLALLSSMDIPAAPCLGLGEVASHPQVQACGTVQRQQHPLLGDFLSPAHPAKFNGQRLPPRQPLAQLGEHSRQILQELGYSEAAIAELLQSNAVA